MMEQIQTVDLEEAIAVMERYESGSAFTDYGKSFRINNGLPLSADRRNKRNQRGILLKSDKELRGVAITARYEAHGGEIFSEWRTLDEVAVVWVPTRFRNQGFGSHLFNHACVKLIENPQPTKWIYVRAVSDNMRKIVRKVDDATNLSSDDYLESESDLLFDVRSPQRREVLKHYCENSNFYMQTSSS
jgi:hypothetical protein